MKKLITFLILLQIMCLSGYAQEQPLTPLPSTGELRFESLKHTYSLSSTPLSFYDDGGKDGKISEQFNGTATFKPSSPNKKVLIDFTKLALLLNTRIGNDDILKVYNGSEVDENMLLTTVNKNTPFVLKSTSTDGALTITLKSVASLPGAGFEASVEEFVPQQMEVLQLSQKQITTGSVAAGDSNVGILSFNIKTKNTEPHLTAESIFFNLNGTSTITDVTKATLYYSGKETEVDTKNAIKIGEVALNNSLEFNITTSQILQEGDNFFWLAYDIDNKAKAGGIIDASCLSVTLSGKSYNFETNNIEGSKTIKNEYISHLGKVEKIFYDTWTFTHNPSPYSNSYYPEEGNQIVTFVPGTIGKVAEIEFSTFDVTYSSSSSYGIRATYKIYNGKDINASNLLWELKNSTDRAIGPNKTIRSTAPDGSLTVVFDAKTNSSPYAGKGWMAQIREYLPKAMEVAEINAFHNNSAIIKPGSNNQEIIGVEISTEGDKTPLTISELKISTKGAQDKIKKISVFYTDKKSFDTQKLFGETTAINNNIGIISTNSPIELPEGKSYLWVTYDINESVASNQAIDASLLTATIGNIIRTAKISDPDGERVTKSICEFANGSQTINVSSSLQFYDNGGSDANYSNAAKGTVTFVPKQGDVIKMTIKKFATAYNDEFFIYSGRAVSKDNLLLKVYGTKPENSIAPIISNAEDGSITIDFQPKKNGEGWEIGIDSYTPLPLTLGEIKTTPINSSTLMRGMENEQMLKVEVEIKGDKGALTINQLAFNTGQSTDNSVITAANVYNTDLISNFSTNKKYGSSQTNSPFAFNEEKKITQPGIYSFWLTYNLASTAQDGYKVESKLTSITINGKPQDVVSNTASACFSKGFKGTYSIGSSADANYPTICSAIDALKNGIEGPVIFEIENGVYNELINIPHILGASSINTITLKSKSGNPSDVTLQFDKYSEPGYSEDKISKEYGLFTVDGADYLTLNGITVTSKDLKFPALVYIKNRSQYFTLSNCRLFAEMSTNYQTDINLVYLYAPNIANMNNDFVTLTNNTFEGGYIGANIGGTGYINLPKEQGAIIKKNNFINQGSKAIYLREEVDAQIYNNIISNNKTDKTDFNAMDIYRGTGSLIIYNNICSLATKNYASAFNLRPAIGTADNRIRIFNNEINFANAIKSSYGISTNADCAYIDIVNNTIKMSGQSENCANLFIKDAMVSVNIENNILQNEAGGITYRANKVSAINGINFAHNALYSNNTNSFAYAEKAIPDFNTWVSISNEKNSFSEKTEFISNELLEPAKMGNLNTARPLDYVLTDIKGKTKSTSNPTIGAYEFSTSESIPQLEQGFPQIKEIKHSHVKVKLRVKNNGKLYYIIKKKTETIPTKEEVVAYKNATARDGQDIDLTVDQLNSDTEYKLYIVTQGTKGGTSEVKEAISFTTPYTPTSTSTFEEVSTQTGDFIDGTASFTGFTIESITDGMGDSKKAAKLNKNGTISLTNSTQGLPLTGFYLKSDAEITIKTLLQNTLKESRTIPTTNNEWMFYNLKNAGDISAVQMIGDGNVYIDDFSGVPQPITFMLEDMKVYQKNKTTLSANIYGGVQPFSYVWKNAKQEVLSTASKYTFNADYTGVYSLMITDAWGNSETSKATITVLGDAKTATFDDLYLAPESHWRGNESISDYYSTFYSGSYTFSNCLMKEYETWALFGYSNETNTSFSSNNFLAEQFRSSVGGGVNGSANYAIVYANAYMGNTTITVTNKPEGDLIRGCYISNSAWGKYAVENGDGLTPGAFTNGDWFKLTAEGKKADGTISSCDFYLADYRSKDEKEHYNIHTWEWFDLTPLGNVTEIKFSMSSTRKNSGGITTPTYFCMDDFNGIRPITNKSLINVGSKENKTINLEELFNFQPSEASIVYKIEETENCDGVVFSINNATLSVQSPQSTQSTFIISASQKGRKEYISLPISFSPKGSVGIERNESNDLHIFPVPAVDKLNISTDMINYKVEVINTSGKTAIVQNGNSGNSSIEIESLENGYYILRISNSQNTIIKRFAKINN